MKPIVIIGNCIAAVSAVEAFRQKDTKTPIIIVSAEPHFAYYRMRLSHLLGENPQIENLFIHPPTWYEENNVDVLLSQKAISIDPVSKTVKLESKTTLSYSQLLMANGSNPFIPPIPGIDLEGVFSIRSIDDVKDLFSFIQGKKSGIVVGGGVLGLETAWALANKGKEITVIEGASYILQKQLDEKAANLLMKQGKQKGINFITGKQISSIEKKQHFLAKLNDHTEIATEFIVFSIGVRPNTELIDGLGIKTGRGIIVDEFMRTSKNDIYAAGDVAEFNGQCFGIWPVAKEQGKIAGLNMAGVETAYNSIVPSNYLKVFDIPIFSVGNIGDADIAIVNLDPVRGIYQKIFFDENHPIGAILYNDTRTAMKLSKAIKEKAPIPEDIIKNNDFEGFLNLI